MVDFIIKYFCSKVDRIIVVCPNFKSQDTFKPMRHLVKDEDIYTKVHDKTFVAIQTKLEASVEKNTTLGLPKSKILIFVDDVAGLSAVQGKGTGAFSHLSVQSRWWNVSMFVLVQQPKRVDVSFRDNAENFIVFQDRGGASYKWLKEAYTALDMNTESVRELVLLAWRGGREDDRERGRHFLFINHAFFGGTKFFIDFTQEIKIHKR